MALVPGFRDTITKFSEKPVQLETFINLVRTQYMYEIIVYLSSQQLNKWSNEARHEDTGSIKHSALEYIPRNPDIDSIKPPITRSHGKSLRGFNHVATARLLCPF